tara:strand:+ start:231 stop:1334 length:1104 start_codon:yes stop_codon:yes gene_type:complete
MINTYYFIILFFLTFFGSYLLLPQIRILSLKFNLTAMPGVRSSHNKITPSFGGIAFFISYIVSLSLLQLFFENKVALSLLGGVSVLFLIGLLDDLLDVRARVKFFGQFLGVVLLMTQAEFRVISLHGFLGIQEIPLFFSIVLSMFFLLGIINAFNLLDGIDGLTAITGIIVASFYSYMFYGLGYFYYLGISITTIATLLAFLRFNFSVSKKIFMGDTGSLTIGLVLGMLTLKLMTAEAIDTSLSLNPKQLPFLLVSVLFVPILDTFRVMIIRFFKGVSMFSPDRNHIHHIIVDYGLSHLKASLLIGLVNIFVGLTMFFVSIKYNTLQSMFFLIGIFTSGILLLFCMSGTVSSLRLKRKLKAFILKIF